VHQRELKVDRVVALEHARADAFHQRTARRTVAQHGKRGGRVETDAFHQRHGFGERGGLYAADEVIDQLHPRATAEWAEVQRATAAHDGEDGTCALERSRIPTDEKQQIA